MSLPPKKKTKQKPHHIADKPKHQYGTKLDRLSRGARFYPLTSSAAACSAVCQARQ